MNQINVGRGIPIKYKVIRARIPGKIFFFLILRYAKKRPSKKENIK